MGYLNEDGLATLVGKVKGQVVQLTAAEYRQIPAETKNTDNKIYFVEDDDYAYAIDNEPTLNSENLVKSGGVYNYTSKIGTGALTTTAQTLIPAVNELKAAVDTNTSDIAELNNGLTGTVTRNISSGTIDSISCIRKGNWVTVSARLYDLSVAASGRFFMIPENFRPSGDVFGFGYMNVTGVGWVPMLSNVHANGEVGVAYSASSTCTQVGFFASYPVDD